MYNPYNPMNQGGSMCPPTNQGGPMYNPYSTMNQGGSVYPPTNQGGPMYNPCSTMNQGGPMYNPYSTMNQGGSMYPPTNLCHPGYGPKCEVNECKNDCRPSGKDVSIGDQQRWNQFPRQWPLRDVPWFLCEECFEIYIATGNLFSLEWKVRQKLYKRLDIIKELGSPRKVIRFLHDNQDLQANEETIKKSFERGEIPLGFHDKLLWRKTADIINEIPSKMKSDEVTLEKLAEEEKAAQHRLDEIEEKRRQIVDEIAVIQSKKKEIEAKLEPYQEILSIYGNMAQLLAQPEEELAMATKTQFENDFNDFAAIDDDATSSPKLSLVFNTFGLSKKVIEKIGGFDGHKFLDSDINELCNEVGLSKFGDVKKLAYIQNMARTGVYLGGQHEDHCPVCSATTAHEFELLLKDHCGRNEDVRVCAMHLEKLEINGRGFLALTPEDLSNNLQIFDKDEDFRRSYSETKRYFERLHHEATME